MKKVFLPLAVLFVFATTANAELIPHKITNYAPGGAGSNPNMNEYAVAPVDPTGETLGYGRSGSAPVCTTTTGDCGSVYATGLGPTKLIFTTAAMGLSDLTWNDIASISWAEKLTLGDNFTQNSDPSWIIQGITVGNGQLDHETNKKIPSLSKTSSEGLDGFTNYTIDFSGETSTTSLVSLVFGATATLPDYELYLDWVMFTLTNGEQHLFSLDHLNGVALPPPAATPEPASMLVFGLGLAGLGLAGRRRMKK